MDMVWTKMRLAGCNKFVLMHTETDIETLMAPFEQQTIYSNPTVVPTKSDSDEIFLLQLLSKTFTCTFHYS